MSEPTRSLRTRAAGTMFAMALLLLYLTPLPHAFAATRTWDGGGSDALASTDANWSDDTAPTNGDHVVLDVTTNKNLTWDLNVPVASWTQDGYTGIVTFETVYGATGFTNFTIAGDCVISNGTWTHNANGASEANRLRVTIGGNLLQAPAGSIDVSGKGYSSGKGPGAGTAGSYGGGGYNGGPTYGSVTSPTHLGSDAGGGAIWLTVGGTATLDGTNVTKSVYAANYSGSGGSILIAAGAIEGRGVINANADGGSYAGGGGRIALVVTNAGADFSNFTGTLTAYGDGNGGSRQGAVGTIYLERGDDDGKGELLVDQGGFGAQAGKYAGFDATGPCTYHFSRITCTNNGTISMDSDDVLILTNTVLQGRASDSDGLIVLGGALACPPDFAYSNFTLRIAATGADFSPADSLTILTNGVLMIDKPHTMACDVVIGPGGLLTHYYGAALDLAIEGSLTVEPGGGVDVTGRGYAKGSGPGALSNGGSHGGITMYANPSYAYGSIVSPITLGSGGGNNTYGGGAILLSVSGPITNNGAISADGKTINYAGAGGSVNIDCGSLHGDGPISSDGGYGYNGSGGGGRIALAVTNAGADFTDFTGDIHAYAGSTRAGAGTVYLRLPGQGLYEGTLIVDHGGINGRETPISASVTDASVADVIIRNNGKFSIHSNQSLRVSGTWSNAATFYAYFGGKVIFTGGSSSTSTLYGATTFMGLVCTNAGKTLRFEDGTTFAVDDLGQLDLVGSGSADVALRSTVDASAWYLNVSNSASRSVSYVNVWDSDASGGATIVAQDSSGERTVNWTFAAAGQTNTWDGSSNTVWGVDANWSLGHAPTADDIVVIPASAPRDPVFDGAKTLAKLAIESGASVSLAGYDLSVVGSTTIGGQLIAASTETVTVQGDVDFSGGAFTTARSTVVLAGDQAQAVDMADLTFYKINVGNNAGTVTFSDGLTATEFRCEAPSGTRDLVFTAGATYGVRDFVVLGAAGDTNITLSSSSPGTDWNLDVTHYSYVRGVDASDSDASGGRTIFPLHCDDGGGNVNWDFSHTWATWLGTNSTDFADAANWSPAAVPDADNCVLMDSANPMAVSADVTVLQLRVGGSVGSTVSVDGALCVVEDITVLDGGELEINTPSVVSNDVLILSGGEMTHAVNGATEANKLTLSIGGDLLLDYDALIDAEAKGYSQNSGPGARSNGGSHGGLAENAPCTYAYGSIVAPTNLGSGGGGGAYGGGAILLSVAGTVDHNGAICADGKTINYAGAGGSVNLVCGDLDGSGTITANGGYGYNGSGGGGRIAVTVTNAGADLSSFSGDMRARSGSSRSGAGTVYLRLPGQGPHEGTLVVENGGTSGKATPVASTVGDAEVGDVILRDAGWLLIDSNQALRVSGIWSNNASFSAQENGAVVFTGGAGSTSVLYNATTFRDLVCTNAGKTLVFEAGETFTVDDLGFLKLAGSGSADVVLRSSTTTTAWYLNVYNSADQSVSYVDVWDSNADGGATVVALDSAGLRTENWTFASAGETNTWDGSSNTVWGVGANWSLNHAPTADDIVIIPTGASRYPVLDASKTQARLTIEAGASLALGGYDLTVVTNAVIAGHLIASSTETLTFQADADFSGGAFTAARSTVVLDAGQAQSVDTEDLIFYKINVANSAGAVTLSDGLTATEFRCEAPSGTRDLVFTATEMYSVRQFVILGAVGDTNITLRSSSPGNGWDLEVTGFSYVRGVDVADSDAGPGRTVYPLACNDVGGNVNWAFSHTWSLWLGTNGTSFAEARNWSPSGVPDADTCVLMDSVNPMVVSAAATVLQLRMGGSVGSTATVDAALCVVEDITVLDGGLLEINRPSVVSNDLFVMSGGGMTHAGNGTTEANKLTLRIDGDLVLDYGSSIDCEGKGYASGQGPGTGGGASYGGTGRAGAMPYGSIVSPTNCGSGGTSGAKNGGGAVLLTVVGAIENNGEVIVDGLYPVSIYTTGAGGTINVVCGSLTGTGVFSAKGAYTYLSAGGGGRISLTLTDGGADFSAFTGDVLVCGQGQMGGAGTIYRQTAADRPSRGTVTIDNNGRTDSYTDFPPACHYEIGEVDHAPFVVTNSAIMRLAGHFTVGDIHVASGATLDLNSLTLTVRTREHPLDGSVINEGEILWVPVSEGSVFVVR